MIGAFAFISNVVSGIDWRHPQDRDIVPSVLLSAEEDARRLAESRIPEFAGLPPLVQAEVFKTCWRQTKDARRVWVARLVAFLFVFGGMLLANQLSRLAEVLGKWLARAIDLGVMLIVILAAYTVADRVQAGVLCVFIRREMGLNCRVCDYQLRGNVSGVCPECGTPIKQAASDAQESAPSRH